MPKEKKEKPAQELVEEQPVGSPEENKVVETTPEPEPNNWVGNHTMAGTPRERH